MAPDVLFRLKNLCLVQEDIGCKIGPDRTERSPDGV